MKKIAIACQGGGSHTAFTAGVLRGLLTHSNYGKDFDIIALSGTSGGALCAGIVWSRLLRENPAASQKELRRMGQEAADTLEAFWMDMACESVVPSMDNQLLFPLKFPSWRRGPFDYMDSAANAAGQIATTFNPFYEFECKLMSQVTRARMEQLLARHLPLELLNGKDLQHPKLRIGATNICEGWTDPIQVEKAIHDYSTTAFHRVLLASASIPPLFQPTQLNGNWYWDGLYSHNPPVECLANPPDRQPQGRPDAKDVPNEIWVIQINPEKCPHPPQNCSGIDGSP